MLEKSAVLPSLVGGEGYLYRAVEAVKGCLSYCSGSVEGAALGIMIYIEGYRGPTKLVQHFAARRCSHRQKGRC